MEPSPTTDLQNPLESAVEERWERYLKEGVLETLDLSFSTLSWAGAESMPLLLSEQLEARQPMEAQHPTEADSVPPGFAAFIGRLRRSRKPQDIKLLPTRSSLSTGSWASRMSQI